MDDAETTLSGIDFQILSAAAAAATGKAWLPMSTV